MDGDDRSDDPLLDELFPPPQIPTFSPSPSMLDAAVGAAGSRGNSPAPRVGLPRPPQAAAPAASSQPVAAAGRAGVAGGRGRPGAGRGVPAAGRREPAVGRVGPTAGRGGVAGHGGLGAGDAAMAAPPVVTLEDHPTPSQLATRKRPAPTKKKDEQVLLLPIKLGHQLHDAVNKL